MAVDATTWLDQVNALVQGCPTPVHFERTPTGASFTVTDLLGMPRVVKLAAVADGVQLLPPVDSEPSEMARPGIRNGLYVDMQDANLEICKTMILHHLGIK